MLVLAATPLGDSRDASPRLREALVTADVIAAEDTRRTRALAAALGVRPEGRIVSFYDAVELDKVPMLMGAIWEGETVLLVTDAGMPSVSRSEEHTSELQSRENLVCRLLLEKK